MTTIKWISILLAMLETTALVLSAASSYSCSDRETDLIIGANSIASFAADSAEDCCGGCESNAACYAWTFEPASNTCYLKDDVFFRVEKLGAISGQIRASPYGNGSIARACATTNTSSFPFCDTSLATQTRVNDLISRLTLAEKVAMLTARQSPSGDVPHLGVPEYDWGTNCIHGVQSRCTQPLTKGDNSTIRCPTSFPNPIGLGAAFNRSLWHMMASVIGIELRALWLQGVGENHADNLPHVGLNCWSPNINIARDPRWGRVLETTGEDPVLTGAFGEEYTLGLQQSDDPDLQRYLQAVVTLKHFAAYSVENYEGVSRHDYDADVSPYDAATTFFPAWRQSIRYGQARGVMCSYNEVNGVPSCASSFLLQDVLRGPAEGGGFGFDGYVTSDSGAIQDIYDNASHGYANFPEEGVALALNASCDVDSSLAEGDEDTGSPYMWYAQGAVDRGLLVESDAVDNAMNRTLFLRFELGLFDGDDEAQNPLWHVDPSVIASDAHVHLAKEATAQSLCLLRNDPVAVEGSNARGNMRASPESAAAATESTTTTLPFARGQKLAVIGPHARAREALLGNYLGQICPEGFQDWSCIRTPFEELAKANVGGDTYVALGCQTVNCETDVFFQEALRVASSADIVVLMLGIDTSIVERESLDRTTIALPGLQEDLAQQILALRKPTATILLHGGALGIDSLAAYGSESLAILSAFYPGPYGSSAIAGAVFGDFSPSGRLPYTMFGAKYVDEKDFLVMDMREGAGSTYKYYEGENVLWPFGFGLEYATFQLSNPSTKIVSRHDRSLMRDDHKKWLSMEKRASDDGLIFDAEDASATLTFDSLTVQRTDSGASFDQAAQLIVQIFIKPVDVPDLQNQNSTREKQGKQQLPSKQLVEFARSPDLLPDSTATVLAPVSMPADAFALADFTTGDLSVYPGSYEVQLWDGHSDEPIIVPVTITGDDSRLVMPYPQPSSDESK